MTVDLDSVYVLDTETSSIDPATGRLLEVAVAEWSVRERSLVSCHSWLVVAGPDGVNDNPAEHVNGIPPGALEYGYERHQSDAMLCKMVEPGKVILCHGADFDRQWLPETIQQRQFICTCDDIEWPRPSSSRSLLALSVAHGLGVAGAHRAVTDTLMLVRLLERAAEYTDIEAMLRRGLRPKAKFQALVSYDTNKLAKERGFRWQPESKAWTRSMAVEDASALPFEVRELAQ